MAAARGWLVIDPKGLLGERTYEYATTLCNPDAAMALSPGRLARQAGVIAEAARLDRDRLLRWTFAHASISAAWCMHGRATIRLDCHWRSPRSPGLGAVSASAARGCRAARDEGDLIDQARRHEDPRGTGRCG